jgi:hypothetical protein
MYVPTLGTFFDTFNCYQHASKDENCWDVTHWIFSVIALIEALPFILLTIFFAVG